MHAANVVFPAPDEPSMASTKSGRPEGPCTAPAIRTADSCISREMHAQPLRCTLASGSIALDKIHLFTAAARWHQRPTGAQCVQDDPDRRRSERAPLMAAVKQANSSTRSAGREPRSTRRNPQVNATRRAVAQTAAAMISNRFHVSTILPSKLHPTPRPQSAAVPPSARGLGQPRMAQISGAVAGTCQDAPGSSRMPPLGAVIGRVQAKRESLPSHRFDQPPGTCAATAQHLGGQSPMLGCFGTP
ncbi:hypothetical protein SCNRRL3882_7952 [Streptomyces chartreusis NRRL 3882]|uniref:Uncharacterized protein n=1 Tax=Streptomyces chartreusis NRRL 3882 TaxID=1079985 RepID=A0A2N9BMB9_STRCX|nr:hypothetical protein SCNRRL3882_0003 [Streptomyces chartreusis NRRL 3882]SOR84507.1 hypothetical protein SCNRRL3882_7952 [Streptomyces chartreusis NRRL 3882]